MDRRGESLHTLDMDATGIFLMDSSEFHISQKFEEDVEKGFFIESDVSLVKDRHGFTLHVIKIKTARMTQYDVEVAIKRFMSIYNIESSIDFDVDIFKIFMWREFKVSMKICNFDVINLKV